MSTPPVYTAEMMLPPVRWVTRHEVCVVSVGPGVGSNITATVRVLQQQWMIDEYNNPRKRGPPMFTRYEWRDVPTVEEE